MPTVNPRVNVTLSPQQYELVSRLAKVQGRSRAAVLLELLETITPTLERVCVALESARRVQEMGIEGFRASVERAEEALAPHVAAAMGQMDLLIGQFASASGAALAGAGTERAAAGGGVALSRPSGGRQDPRPVTRGSGGGGRRGKGSPVEALAAAIARRVQGGPEVVRGRRHK